ncbi:MAG: aminopeptidase P family protein [Acidobacteria bacterium]|nr:aminopeptidase P family protein [Acidobacteriota bacterium]
MLEKEYQDRRRLACADLQARTWDGLVVSTPVNVRYLSGFTGSSAALVLEPGGQALLFTDPRYAIQAGEETGCRVRVVKGPLPTAVSRHLARRRLRRIGFENTRISFAAHQELSRGATLEPAETLIEDRRMIKSPAEIELIRQSMLVASRAYDRVIRAVRPGMTEAAVAAELDHQMRRLGAEGPAFPTIVAAGPRSALPHASPGPVALKANQLLLIDMGASRNGYASDMTRTVFLGRPAVKAGKMYRAVLEAQQAAIATVRDGVQAAAVERAARRRLRADGLDRAFVHSTGHGLGLEIHEAPRIGRRDKTLLRAGMVVTIEPGVYLEGYGGIRIEDTVAVTADGCEVLTPNSKELAAL